MFGYIKQTNGTKVTEEKVTFKKIDWFAPTIYHGIEWVFTAYDNREMDQFDLVPFDKPPNQASGKAAYAYLDPKLIPQYRQMAYDYTLADHMFPTAWGGSFSAHLDLIAGTTRLSSSEAATVPNNTPWGCDAPKGTQTQILTPQHHWSTNPPNVSAVVGLTMLRSVYDDGEDARCKAHQVELLRSQRDRRPSRPRMVGVPGDQSGLSRTRLESPRHFAGDDRSDRYFERDLAADVVGRSQSP